MALLQVMLCNLFQHSEHENNTDFILFSLIYVYLESNYLHHHDHISNIHVLFTINVSFIVKYFKLSKQLSI